ncbi:glycoside hydrolase family 5 protein [Cylindrobasidium torrendii FP15055 ss-10]|uniref:glucan 1,3-beta-glucosidase n=1 Tax=Cylindrobasidium torrendii FP15055 ss-10 TaxID=1314674 RepID=A0A0D7BJT7_9AGAR|nr:glycoside hydrolase family 5 protein [Cylindrobasidium torrendii FP15055 ss-10]
MLVIASILLLLVAIAVPVAVVLSRKSSSSSSPSTSTPVVTVIPWDGSTSGANGSTTWSTSADGSAFTYVNEFGGEWQYDPTNPLGPGGKSQSWGKRIGEEEWVWGQDIVRGVNIGGWLVTEPFICPDLYERWINKTDIAVVDEWTLALAMGDKLAEEMERHYSTFITEEDFAQIAGAGLNWVRIPIGFWAIETIGDEPLLPKVSWKYFLKAIEWCRKYGIRIYLDLHALPGSQNGWNHSGKAGSVNFLNGAMGLANAQRTLSYIKTFTEFISQDQYKDVVPMMGIVNEILWATIGETSVKSFYSAAYETIRNVTGIGADKGPYLIIHEGFQGTAVWEGFLEGADRLALDQHPYLAFMNDYISTPDEMASKACAWAAATNRSQSAFGVTLGGEWSAAINNCGLWLNGIGSSPGGYDCAKWDAWASYTDDDLKAIKNVALASMDALQNWFFWTWKIGESSVLKTSSSPLWNYKLGREHGWIPKDPREAAGFCAGILKADEMNLFDGKFPASATGSASGVVSPTQMSSWAFPPASMAPSFTAMSVLPTYTATGTFVALGVPTFAGAPPTAKGASAGPTPTVQAGSGWTTGDEGAKQKFVAIQGCAYPDAWNAATAAATPC